jgi:L-xylulokinase
MHVEQSGCLGAAIAAAVGTGLYPGFAEAMTAMCPSGEWVAPDASSFSAYRSKYAAFRRLADTLAVLPAGL